MTGKQFTTFLLAIIATLIGGMMLFSWTSDAKTLDNAASKTELKNVEDKLQAEDLRINSKLENKLGRDAYNVKMKEIQDRIDNKADVSLVENMAIQLNYMYNKSGGE